MPIQFSAWPPTKYDPDNWPDNWLRFEAEYPGSGRRSRLAAHADVPYSARVTNDEPTSQPLGRIASDYIQKLQTYLAAFGKSLDLPAGWDNAFKFPDDDSPQAKDLMHWLDVWPPVDAPVPDLTPRIASWNLSRNPNGELPANIIMVASEFLNGSQTMAAFNFGLRVPMLVQADDNGFRVTIRSMTAEYLAEQQLSWSQLVEKEIFPAGSQRTDVLASLVRNVSDRDSPIVREIAASAAVVPASIEMEEFWITSEQEADLEQKPIVIETVSKALGSINRNPHRLSYQVFSKIEVSFGQVGTDINARLISTETCPLVTHVGQGEVMIFDQTPPAENPGVSPPAHYDWTLRRPTRRDEMLETYRRLWAASGGPDKELKDPGFNVRLCPQFVKADRNQLPGATDTKKIELPANKQLPPRRDEFSAVSAYYNSSDFFEMLGGYGIFPGTFVVRAQTDIQVFYRYGITPGPGGGGRTLNAQVAFDCHENGGLPPIRMNLALAELSRWSRPVHPDGKRTWAEPLGIATDVRWMMHEFGHYLLAARLGKLEFDFAHSAGDAMAAIYADPDSRLADRRRGVAESFRGVTYPYVFSTRRHDRTPRSGWAWYGGMNRAVIQAPPRGCDVTKGYLTEQILSSTLFRLYRALGGDTHLADDPTAPDVAIRRRASFVTLYLLIKAIQGFAQSPTKAEMLELGMEDASLLLGGDLELVPQPSFPIAMPQPDGWRGGMMHKVVRWTFEMQGMFPDDPTIPLNGVGQPPTVDIYIEDRRPQEELTPEGRMTYGRGSYAPVSLDWADDALWFAKDGLTLGNRGSQAAEDVTGRFWVGIMQAEPTVNQGLTTTIEWTGAMPLVVNSPIASGQTEPLDMSDIDIAIAEAQTIGAVAIVVLIEVTCPVDRANTDPLADLAVRVDDPDDLPKTPRALVDLVANDNNLGLFMLH